MYEEYKVYGPYTRKDNRKHVVLVHKTNKSRKTVSYPKYLVECNLNRYLLPTETVDHNDRNFTNDDINNLIVKDRSIHCTEDALRVISDVMLCPMCKTEFVLTGKQVSSAKSNAKNGKAGPFCGRSCAGRYGAYLQNGLISKLGNEEVKANYYKLDK